MTPKIGNYPDNPIQLTFTKSGWINAKHIKRQEGYQYYDFPDGYSVKLAAIKKHSKARKVTMFYVYLRDPKKNILNDYYYLTIGSARKAFTNIINNYPDKIN